MRTVKTIGYKVIVKFNDIPHAFRTLPDFNTQKQAGEVADKLSGLKEVEEVSVAVNIEELLISIEGNKNAEDIVVEGFGSAVKNT